MDIIIRNGKVRETDHPVDIGIAEGYIKRTAPAIENTASLEVDANGGMVLPAFVDAHTHLDIAYFGEIGDPPAGGTLADLLSFTSEIKREQTVADVEKRMERALREAVANGTTAIRTNLDVSADWGLTSVKAALNVKKSYADIVDLQTVAMPFGLIGPSKEEGLTEADTERLERALEMGVDAIGGETKAGAIDPRERDAIETFFELAKSYDVDIDLHTDGKNSPAARATEYLARRTVEAEMQGRVHISHVSALSHYDEWHRRDVLDLIARAGLNVVTNPKEDQMVPDHDTTAVTELLDAGVNVSIGHNDIAVPVSPYGGLDLVQHAWLLAHVAGMRTRDDAERLIDMITHNPANAIGVDDYGIEDGCRANLIVCRENSIIDLLRTRKSRRAVIKDGQLVASTECSTTVTVE